MKALRDWWKGLPGPMQATVILMYAPLSLAVSFAFDRDWLQVFTWGVTTVVWLNQIVAFHYGRAYEAYKRSEQDLKEWQEKVREDNPQWDITFGSKPESEMDRLEAKARENAKAGRGRRMP